MDELDLVIRGGTIVDGSGGRPYLGDVGVRNGRIVAVGQVDGAAAQEVDAAGCLVTPGFVDIHTHYDGQVTWEHRMMPSSAHGVTTVVMGNCGVGFAPCRAEDRASLIALMEGVEDIPDAVMSAGLPWNWETFPEYLDAVAKRNFDVDVAAYLPHSCLRVYVMGERGIAREVATEDDRAEMRRITAEAMQAGAMGFATSRSIFHLDKFGTPVPTKDSAEPEIDAIGQGMRMAGHGVIEALIDYDDIDSEFGLLRDVSKRNELSLTFTIAQLLDKPHGWKRSLQLVEQAVDDGVNVKGQVIGRPTGLLLGLELSYNPFSLYPAYQEIAGLPLEERIAQMRRPEVRERIINDKAAGAKLKLLDYIQAFSRTYLLGDPPDYAPPPEASIESIAERQGVSPLEVAYDMLLQDEGKAILFVTVGNYAEGNLDAVTALLTDPNTMMGLGDGGAHYGIISDAAYPTFMLTFWCRDKDGFQLSLPEVIEGLTKVPAEFIGFLDRGQLALGYKADINIIDLDRLHLHAPHPVFDLPSGGRRLVQRADGYVATFVDGVMTYSEGEHTGALPGKLIRGPQSTPKYSAELQEAS